MRWNNQEMLGRQANKFLPVICLCCLLGVSLAQAGTPTSLKIESGLIEGTVNAQSGVRAYKGIPFAAPPIGDLRWQAPQLPAPWIGVLKADRFGPSCMQALTRRYLPWTEEYMISNDVSEDCLTLNVWSPAKNPDEKSAVLLFIHGGAYTGGGSEVSIYDGEQLAKKGIVVVTANYRVGIFGFLAHNQLTKEQGQSGNYGLLDNIAALQWLQRNIAAFGGDPNRVTIAGQSAGASSVHYLSVSPLAKGLFHRAIAQSGPWHLGRQTSELKWAEKLSEHYLNTWKIKEFSQLRAMPASKLQALDVEFANRFLPNVDGYLLPAQVDDLYEKGEAHEVPLLTGITADEGSSNSEYGVITAKEFNAQAKQEYGNRFADFSSLYPVNTDSEASEALRQIARDKGLLEISRWAAFRNRYLKADTYAYFMQRVSPWPEYPRYAAFHSSDLPYVFNNLHRSPKSWEESDRQLAELMSDYWVNFIKTGNPNSSIENDWTPVGNKMMVFDSNSQVKKILSEAKLKFWANR